MGPNIRRTRSSDPVLPSLPQVDGSGEKRKVKKAKPKKKSSKNKKNKGKGKSGGGDEVVVDTQSQVKMQVEGDRGGEVVVTGDDGVEKSKSCSPPSYASVAGDEMVDEKTKTAPEAAHAASLKERILAALSVSRDGSQSQRSPSYGAACPSGGKGGHDTDASATRVQSDGSGINNDRTADAADAVDGNASPGQRAAANENPIAGNPNPDPFASHVDDSSEGTVRILGADDKGHYSYYTDREALLFCQVHGRPLCRFDPSCCVHRPLVDCGCPPKQSCCCLHHNGDCCSCLMTRKAGFAGSGAETPSNTDQTVEDGDVVVAEGNTASVKKSELNLMEQALRDVKLTKNARHG